MVKLEFGFRIFTILALLFVSLILNPNSVVGEDSTQTFSGVLGSGPGGGNPSAVSYVASVAAGDMMSLTVDYSGTNSCLDGWLHVTVDGQILSPWVVGLFSNFSGSVTYPYEIYTTGDVIVGVQIVCRHATGFFQRMELFYTLTIKVDSPSAQTPNPIEAELAAGLQRITIDSALPVVIYTPTPAAAENSVLFIDVWQLDEQGVGRPTLTISTETLLALPDFPTQNILIARDGLTSVYKLTTGEYQVNVGPLPDGKVHVIIFDGIPPTHTYGYTWLATPN